jgi:sugar transferase (PEP-CTERM/EpsH1 system associated)
MRLLCLTPRLPWPPDRGDRLRAYRLLATFAEDHRLTLLSAVERRRELEGVRELRPLCEAVHTVVRGRAHSTLVGALNAWRPLPLQVLYYRDRRFRARLARLLEESFDAIYVQLFRLAPYVTEGRRDWPPRILDLTDVVSGEIARSLPYRRGSTRWLLAREARRIAAYEGRVAALVEEVWVVSEAERRALGERAPGAAVRVVPNGVDGDRFRPRGVASVAGRLLFVGNMDVAHNIDAARFLARQVLPRVRRRVPDATLRLVGAGGGRRVAGLAARAGVEWVGFVPDLQEELERAAVFVAPLRFSAGLQNKVLEAMAAARPVVTTVRVQEGLDAVPGRHLLVGEDAETLADQVARLLVRPDLGAELGRAAREHAVSRFSWDLARQRLRTFAPRS